MESPAGTGFRRALWDARPTEDGRRLIWAASLCLCAAWATHRPSLFAAAALLLALYGVAHIAAARAAASLDADWDCPVRVHAGETFPLRIRLRNRGLLPVTGVEIHEPGLRSPIPAAVSGLLRPGGTVPVEVRGRVRRRGRHRLPAPTVAVRWPFLLALAARPLGGEREVLAYPRRVPVPMRTLRSPAVESAAHESAAAALRGGALFRGIREWTPGDAPRAIAWRATARHGRLLSREFEREDAGRAVVLLDADARGLPAAERTAAVERACSLAASLLLRLRAAGRRTTFAAWTPEPLVVRSVSSGSGIARALEALALLEAPTRKEPRRDPLALLPPGLLRGARVLLVRAGPGTERTRRGPGGLEVRVLPSLRAAFAAEGAS